MKYKFKVGNLVKSTKYQYLITARGKVPEKHDLVGYEVLNLTTKAQYWTEKDMAHQRYKVVSNSTTGLVLYGE